MEVLPVIDRDAADVDVVVVVHREHVLVRVFREHVVGDCDDIWLVREACNVLFEGVLCVRVVE